MTFCVSLNYTWVADETTTGRSGGKCQLGVEGGGTVYFTGKKS